MQLNDGFDALAADNMGAGNYIGISVILILAHDYAGAFAGSQA